MQIRIIFNDKINRYVIQKKQYFRWGVAKHMTTRKNPKWWQTTKYLKPCIFDTKKEAEKFLNQHHVMINNYDEKELIEIVEEEN